MTQEKIDSEASEGDVSFYNVILSFLTKRRVTDIVKLVSFEIACESSSPEMNLMNFIDNSNWVFAATIAN